MDNSDIIDALRHYSYAFTTEATLHEGVAMVLTEHEIPYEREKQLSARGRIEFYLPGTKLGIECKIDGSETAVMRQLLRYTESDLIDELVLLTTRNKHRRIPAELGGKPVHLVYVGAF